MTVKQRANREKLTHALSIIETKAILHPATFFTMNINFQTYVPQPRIFANTLYKMTYMEFPLKDGRPLKDTKIFFKYYLLVKQSAMLGRKSIAARHGVAPV